MKSKFTSQWMNDQFCEWKRKSSSMFHHWKLSLEVDSREKISTASRKLCKLERTANINIFPCRSYRSSARIFFSSITARQKKIFLLSFASTVDSFAGPLLVSRCRANCSWSFKGVQNLIFFSVRRKKPPTAFDLISRVDRRGRKNFPTVPNHIIESIFSRWKFYEIKSRTQLIVTVKKKRFASVLIEQFILMFCANIDFVLFPSVDYEKKWKFLIRKFLNRKFPWNFSVRKIFLFLRI